MPGAGALAVYLAERGARKPKRKQGAVRFRTKGRGAGRKVIPMGAVERSRQRKARKAAKVLEEYVKATGPRLKTFNAVMVGKSRREFKVQVQALDRREAIEQLNRKFPLAVIKKVSKPSGLGKYVQDEYIEAKLRGLFGGK